MLIIQGEWFDVYEKGINQVSKDKIIAQNIAFLQHSEPKKFTQTLGQIT